MDISIQDANGDIPTLIRVVVLCKTTSFGDTVNNEVFYNSTNVNTGDNSSITSWENLLGLSGLLSLGNLVLSKKRKMNKY